MTGVYVALATVVVGAHFAYLALLAFGGLAARRWPQLLRPHLLAVAWALGAVTVRYDCPLTALEQRLREQAGQALYDGGFIRHYIRGVLFPEWMTPIVVLGMAGLIVVGWIRLALRAPA